MQGVVGAKRKKDTALGQDATVKFGGRSMRSISCDGTASTRTAYNSGESPNLRLPRKNSYAEGDTSNDDTDSDGGSRSAQSLWSAGQVPSRSKSGRGWGRGRPPKAANGANTTGTGRRGPQKVQPNGRHTHRRSNLYSSTDGSHFDTSEHADLIGLESGMVTELSTAAIASAMGGELEASPDDFDMNLFCAGLEGSDWMVWETDAALHGHTTSLSQGSAVESSDALTLPWLEPENFTQTTTQKVDNGVSSPSSSSLTSSESCSDDGNGSGRESDDVLSYFTFTA